jgi:GST-like protein
VSADRGFTLYGGRGGGSAAVEVALRLAGVPYAFVDAASWSGPEARAARAPVDFIGQIPILVGPDGEAMTESAAMLLWIAEAAPQAKLAPPPGDPRRRAFLRWLMFLAANMYGSYAVSDRPERWIDGSDEQARLKLGAAERRKMLWRAMESAVAPAPFLLGSEMTILDVYLAMMSRWTPGRAWFEESCPKLTGAARAAEAHPVVAAVWAENFKPAI